MNSMPKTQTKTVLALLASLAFLPMAIAQSPAPAPRAPEAPEVPPVPGVPPVPDVNVGGPYIIVNDEEGEVDVRFFPSGFPAAFLGVNAIGLTEELCEHFDVAQEGAVMIAKVYEESPAEEAGLRVGDIITSIDNKAVKTSWELQRQIARREAEEIVLVDVIRDGRPQTIQAKLGERKKLLVGLDKIYRGELLPLPEMEGLEKLEHAFPAGAYQEAIREMTKALKEDEIIERLEEIEEKREKAHRERMRQLERQQRELRHKLRELEERMRERERSRSRESREPRESSGSRPPREFGDATATTS